MLRLLFQTVLRIVAGSYFVLTSLYCLLAYLPYTYCAFIKAPPYPWMPGFVHHQAALYWVAAAAVVVAALEDFSFRNIRKGKYVLNALLTAAFLAFGIYLTAHPFLPSLQNDRLAYWWSLGSLLPVIVLSVRVSSIKRPSPRSVDCSQKQPEGFGYSSGVLVAVMVSMIYMLATRIQVYHESRAVDVHRQFFDIALWSLLSHVAVALAAVSALNLIYSAALKTSQPQVARRWMLGLVVIAGLYFILERFLNDAMSFDGWSAYIYALFLAVSLTLWGFSLVSPFIEQNASRGSKLTFMQVITTWAAVAIVVPLAVMSRSLIGGEDWNGIVGSSWAMVTWIALTLCIYRLRASRRTYSLVSIVAILLGSAFVYKGLQFTGIFWSKPLGSTDDEISLALEDYGSYDASFLLAHHLLGNSRHEACGDLCRILREYTNVRDTHVSQGITLVDNLIPTQGDRPNIFFFVIDAMRPDYLGAYNPRVDYTPNLDALARESIVLHNAYSQYAGTSLSEPAIWSGAMLLHAHYPQPFSQLNSLDRVLHTDGYQMMVSNDEVLGPLLPAGEDVVRLDTDKKLWNQLELGSTLRQAEAALDARTDPNKPVFLYAQPKNVHQFARNDVPSPASQHWPDRPGLNTRITYEVHWVDSCFGQFFAYLKKHGMYDNSIIIVTSDHGDATGEFGRTSHSTSIWPEIMHVPLIVHLPQTMRSHLVYDDSRLSTLTDVTPSLYYLLGHKPIRQNPLYGRPLFTRTQAELDSFPKRDLLLASDVRAVYGILTTDRRYLYTTYDAPAQSYLFDLTSDPDAQHSVLTPDLKRSFDEQIIGSLHLIGDYYGYHPGVGSLLASTSH